MTMRSKPATTPIESQHPGRQMPTGVPLLVMPVSPWRLFERVEFDHQVSRVAADILLDL